jgi:hypothetical protein
MITKIFTIASVLLMTTVLQACKHPLVIVGEGDIVDANNTGRGCTLEQFQAQATACTGYEISDNYLVNYKAEPRPGWRFARWEGACSPTSDFQHCRLDASKAAVDWWHEYHPDTAVPPSTAVFEPITGNSGFLTGPAVAGVAWETATQQGVTGLDGGFQYEEGETVRFMVGDTLVGKAPGQPQVTIFDLAGSVVHTGIDISWALQDEEGPFQTVINTAVFLQSLDHDADPKNGIQIRPGTAALFKRVSLDVSQHWRAFQDESALRHALALANRTQRFSAVHGIVAPAAALAQLYQALDVNPLTLGVSQLQLEDENGNLERIEHFQYDAGGTMIRHDDGTPESFESWHHDASGNMTRHERYAENYGAYNVIETYHYDANARLTRKTRDYDADGTLEEIFSWHYQYNSYGNITSATESYDGSDTPANVETWQYDTRGNVTRKSEDWDADGTPNNIETWQYGTRGNIARHEWDWNGDATPDSVEAWQYDARGNVTRLDSGQGSDWYSLKTWRYDANDNVTQLTEDWNIDDYDEEPRGYIESWHYNSDGNATRLERINVDGTLDAIETWQYDSYGNVTEFTEDSQQGITTIVQNRNYDANGNVTLLEIEEYDDGSVVIAGNDGPGYDGGELFSNGVALPESAINDIAFITYVDGSAHQHQHENGRDQGQIFGTGGTVRLTSDTLSQSITTGITGQLTAIQIQWNGKASTAAPLMNFSIVAGGNPPTGDVLYFEALNFESAESNDVFTWDLTAANLFFEAGDRFTLTLNTQGEDIPNRLHSYRYEYNASGKLVRFEEDDGGDGMPDIVETWQYDANGKLTQFLQKVGNGEGGFDQATSYQFEATGWGHLFGDMELWPHGSWPPWEPRLYPAEGDKGTPQR